VFEISGQEYFAALVGSFPLGGEDGVCPVRRWLELVIARTCKRVASEEWLVVGVFEISRQEVAKYFLIRFGVKCVKSRG
jgi:hypothetical protein